MSEASIPVDLYNPGQVFACLGLLEAADALLGDAEGCFDWAQPGNTFFRLRHSSAGNPFETVLRKFSQATLREIYPKGWPDIETSQEDEFPSPLSEHVDEKGKTSTTKLPGVLSWEDRSILLASWSDGSSRPDFKLYSGNRSGCSIAAEMLFGKREAPKKGKTLGDVSNQGVRQLLESDTNALVADPLNRLVSMAGSFNMDPRGAWNSMDAGYSPNQHGDDVAASPVVEFFACLALEHFRPLAVERGLYYYAAWQDYLPPSIARVVCSGADTPFLTRRFVFSLALSGKNKLITFASQSSQ